MQSFYKAFYKSTLAECVTCIQLYTTTNHGDRRVISIVSEYIKSMKLLVTLGYTLIFRRKQLTSRSKVVVDLLTMKHNLLFCICTALIYFAPCDTDCMDGCNQAVNDSASTAGTESEMCTAARNYLSCIGSSCGTNMSDLYRDTIYQNLRDSGFYCDGSVASRTVTGSLLAVSGAMLLTAYRTFNLWPSLSVQDKTNLC